MDLQMTLAEGTDLSVREKQSFRQLSPILPFLADLLHARLRVYLGRDGAAHYLLAARYDPHTFYMPRDSEPIGTAVPHIEEPLVEETFHTGRPCQGKREWRLGAMSDLFTYAVEGGAGVFCVLSFETDFLRLSLDDYEYLRRAGFALLAMARKAEDEAVFRPIQPQSGILIADGNSRIVFADASAQRIYRVLGVGSLKGRRLSDQLLRHCVTRETVDSRTPWQREIQAAGRTLVRREIVIRDGGESLWTIVLLSDVTETRKKDEEIRIQAAVIQEIHHRVKNNLQTIASLLRLQARRAKSEEVRAALSESIDRILSISVAHEYLSQQGTETIDVQEVLEHILTLVARSMAAGDFAIETEYVGARLILPSDAATSLALVLNELVLNSMEHGFAGRNRGRITLTVSETARDWRLLFENDGAPLPADFSTRRGKSLGLTIIRTLVEGDLSGEVTMEDRPGGGVQTLLVIPKTAGRETED